MTFVVSREHVESFDQWARARDGNPYGYGGAFNLNPDVSTDCSGLVLQSAAYLTKVKNWVGNRFGSTESFRLDYPVVYELGFKRFSGDPSRLPFKPLLLVGLQHGGGGIYSHTACTFYGKDVPGGPVKESARGVDWESQGNGVYYYEGARYWKDSLFHDFWYLDAKLAPAAPAVNEIDAEAKRAAAWLGKRKSVDSEGKPVEHKAPDGEGRFAHFENGSVYWHPRVNADQPVGLRAVAVPKDVFEVWARVGFETGPLGYPLLRHVVDKGVGTIQGFTGGAVYRKYGTSGGVLVGRIGDSYYKDGAEKSPLGWPLGDEEFFQDGRVQQFENGKAYWHASGVTKLLNGK
ncbi:lysin A [Gordonia phage Ghobes]|uniref:Lysin A n=1 Tax=Gordonia phage Ghobes TaxID=1887647 RepID=A0A1B3B095_9CAUD|nr:endolysin [Gordonia phage Ghobes]AOE44412.1 lysin A [Gordonia phage Ghobes]